MVQHEANRRYYEQLKEVWDASKHLALISSVDENKAWEKFRARIKSGETAIPVHKKKDRNWLKIAASIILIATIASVTYLFINRQPAVEELIVQTGSNVLTDTLPDGSVITLNKESFLLYPSSFSGKERVVTLKGEAFFDVSPDKEKPFIVHVNDIDVRVVGTSFNIKSKNDKTEVIVESGIVRVTSAGKTVELKAGERVRLDNAGTEMVKEQTTDKLYNYYRSREFVCDDTPLWKLVEVLNEAYEANIVIGREELKNLRITSPFYNESLDRVLDVISMTLNIRVVRSSDKIILE
jgi:transmembrane sensor